MRRTQRGLAILLLLIAAALHPLMALGADDQEDTAVIYYNEACTSCSSYLEDELIPTLQGNGINSIELRDYINEPNNRKLYNRVNEDLGIPLELREHIETVVGNSLVFSGHVPADLIDQGFNLQSTFEMLLIYQEEMHDAPTHYTAWAGGESMQTYQMNAPLSDYAAFVEETPELIGRSGDAPSRFMLPLILWSGLLDGINPCAIAVLIFFIAFLFTLKAKTGKILRYGLLYIAVIYLTYLGIGLGLFKAIVFSDTPHLMAKVGSWLIIVLGAVNVINYYVPKFPVKLRIPKFTQSTLRGWLTKATLPAVIIGAFLVGLCTFPCSGGIYVAVIGLLTAQQTFIEGLGYLLIYNVMFVVPLIILLSLIGNKQVLGRFATWQKQNDAAIKLWSGIVMIALGVSILAWFT